MLKLFKLMEALDSTESATEFIDEILQNYKPVVYNIIGEAFGMYVDLNNNDEYFAEKAKRKQKYLDAYMTAGFSREEALLFLLDSDLKKDRVLNMLSSSATQVPATNM